MNSILTIRPTLGCLPTSGTTSSPSRWPAVGWIRRLRTGSGWASLDFSVSDEVSARTVAWMYYCWKDPAELFWRSGMAMTISGSATNSGASIPNLNYSSAKMTVGSSEATSLEDAEHKLLDWALGQTEKGTVGIAGMAHMGPLDTCASCQVAIQYFQNERKFILLINHPRAIGPSGVYSKSLWFNRLVGKGLFPQPGLNW
jgi:hypothetical protein